MPNLRPAKFRGLDLDAQTAGIGELGALRVVSVSVSSGSFRWIGLELPAKGEDRRSHDSDWLQKLPHRISRHISCTHPEDRLLLMHGPFVCPVRSQTV